MKILQDKYERGLSWQQAWPKVVARLENILLDFELLVLTFVGYLPLHSLRNLIYRFSGVKIGQKSAIHMWARFYDPKNIVIGQDSIIGDHVFLDGRDRLVIGNHVDVASQVLIYNSQHDINSADFVASTSPVEIGDYVFVGPRAIILPGVRVNKGAIVGAGAVVTKDVAEFAIVAGVPAVKIGERKNKQPSYILGRARLFQ